MPRGTAIIIEPIVTARDPTTIGNMPNSPWVGLQSIPKRNSKNPTWMNAGKPSLIIKMMMAKSIKKDEEAQMITPIFAARSAKYRDMPLRFPAGGPKALSLLNTDISLSGDYGQSLNSGTVIDKCLNDSGWLVFCKKI